MEKDKAAEKKQGLCCGKTLAVSCDISGILDEKKLVKDISRFLSRRKKNQVFGH